MDYMVYILKCKNEDFHGYTPISSNYFVYIDIQYCVSEKDEYVSSSIVTNNV